MSFDITIKFATTSCNTCGITFAVPDRLIEARRTNDPDWDDDSDWIFCPNGHRLAYGTDSASNKSLAVENADLRRRLNTLLAKQDQAAAAVRDAAEIVGEALEDSSQGDATKINWRAIWKQIVPEPMDRIPQLRRYRGGVVHAQVMTASQCLELDKLLRNGIEKQLVEKSGGTIKSVRAKTLKSHGRDQCQK